MILPRRRNKFDYEAIAASTNAFSPLYLDNCIRRLITRQKRRQTRIFKKGLAI
jgi:hypothetical protein